MLLTAVTALQKKQEQVYLQWTHPADIPVSQFHRHFESLCKIKFVRPRPSQMRQRVREEQRLAGFFEQPVTGGADGRDELVLLFALTSTWWLTVSECTNPLLYISMWPQECKQYTPSIMYGSPVFFLMMRLQLFQDADRYINFTARFIYCVILWLKRVCAIICFLKKL